MIIHDVNRRNASFTAGDKWKVSICLFCYPLCLLKILCSLQRKNALPCFFLDREPDKVEEPNNYFCGEASFVSVLKMVA